MFVCSEKEIKTKKFRPHENSPSWKPCCCIMMDFLNWTNNYFFFFWGIWRKELSCRKLISDYTESHKILNAVFKMRKGKFRENPVAMSVLPNLLLDVFPSFWFTHVSAFCGGFNRLTSRNSFSGIWRTHHIYVDCSEWDRSC